MAKAKCMCAKTGRSKGKAVVRDQSERHPVDG